MIRDYIVAVRYQSTATSVPPIFRTPSKLTNEDQALITGTVLRTLAINVSTKINESDIVDLLSHPYQSNTLTHLRSAMDPDIIYIRSQEGYCKMRLVRIVEWFDQAEEQPNWEIVPFGELYQEVMFKN